MARPKKPEERNRIRDVAFNVFSTKGFDNSSFSDIAKEAAVSKSLVQYYFPKKEQFIADFIQKSLSVTEELVQELDISYDNAFAKLYAIGYAQFYFAMYNEKMSTLRMDLLKDRGNTELILKHGLNWMAENTNSLPEEQEQLDHYKRTVVFVIGGAFDYLYDCLLYGVPVDEDFLDEASTAVLEPLLHFPLSAGASIRKTISKEWLAASMEVYNQKVFTV